VGHHRRLSRRRDCEVVRAGTARLRRDDVAGHPRRNFRDLARQHVGWYQSGESAGFIGAIVGAVLILAIYRSLSGPPRY
jgi:hypothetical protein